MYTGQEETREAKESRIFVYLEERKSTIYRRKTQCRNFNLVLQASAKISDNKSTDLKWFMSFDERTFL